MISAVKRNGQSEERRTAAIGAEIIAFFRKHEVLHEQNGEKQAGPHLVATRPPRTPKRLAVYKLN